MQFKTATGRSFMKWFEWQSVLRPLSAEELIGRSIQRYMRELIRDDLEERLKHTEDEFEKVMYLDALREIYEVEDLHNRYDDVRSDLARLKKKHRRRIARQRKKLVEFLGI